MKIKISDYICDYLASKGLDAVFTVVGGGAMHMNDSFGHDKRFHCIYQHHEQACAMAAEGYARINNKPAICCVTSGPGAVNALNGVCGAYQDSIPMIVLSGQTKTTMTVKNSGLRLRTLGNQEFNIVSALSEMTKYSEMLMTPGKIKWVLDKAYISAITGRPGPVWIDIPLDVQGSFVDTEELEQYNPDDDDKYLDDVFNGSHVLTGEKLRNEADRIATLIKKSQRPVLYAGNGIRLSGAVDVFNEFVKKIKIPVVTCWDSVDIIETESPYYCGRGGTMGNRAGNFAVQNCDLLICIGTRLNIYQVGYNKQTWARAATVIVCDIDSEELKKPTIRVDVPICADAGDFIEAVDNAAKSFDADFSEWLKRCMDWKEKYPVVEKRHYEDTNKTNVYAFIDTLSRKAGNDSVTVVANGSASVVGSQAYYIGKNQRFIMNCGMSSMGYDLPAAVGACIAKNNTPVICIAGDGSIQMNIQELQTIVTNKLAVKIFIISNDGYHQIRQTQNNIFHNGLVGVGPESNDLGFPDFEKVAYAYGIPFERINKNSELNDTIEKVLQSDGPVICDVICNTSQIFEPKSATKKLADGTLFSPPLEDMAPFIARDELENNMIIPLVNEINK